MQNQIDSLRANHHKLKQEQGSATTQEAERLKSSLYQGKRDYYSILNYMQDRNMISPNATGKERHEAIEAFRQEQEILLDQYKQLKKKERREAKDFKSTFMANVEELKNQIEQIEYSSVPTKDKRRELELKLGQKEADIIAALENADVDMKNYIYHNFDLPSQARGHLVSNDKDGRLTDYERDLIEESFNDEFIAEMLEYGYKNTQIEHIKKHALENNHAAIAILENYESPTYGRGYSGYSMSTNAIDAYEHLQKPLSKWTSQDSKAFSEVLGHTMSLKDFKEFLSMYGEAGYHHTSKHYNKTTFYSLPQAVLSGKEFLENKFGDIFKERATHSKAMIGELGKKEQDKIHKDLLESDMKTTKDIIQFAKEQGLSVKETKEMIQANSMKDKETFIDSNGVKREISKDVAEMWKNTFGLKSLNDSYIPNFSKEVKAALDSVLNGKDIELRFGSLIKLINKNRLDIMPKIKEVLESPNKILDDGQGILFIKEFVDSDKNRYFMSVAKNYNGEWILSSHVRRELSNIENKIRISKVLYDKGFKGE